MELKDVNVEDRDKYNNLNVVDTIRLGWRVVEQIVHTAIGRRGGRWHGGKRSHWRALRDDTRGACATCYHKTSL